MGIYIQLRRYEGQGLQVLREAIQPSTPLPDFLIMIWNTAQLFHCKEKENRKPTFHNFTPSLKENLKFHQNCISYLVNLKQTKY